MTEEDSPGLVSGQSPPRERSLLDGKAMRAVPVSQYMTTHYSNDQTLSPQKLVTNEVEKPNSILQMIATRAQVSRLRSGAGGGMASPGRSLSKMEQAVAMNKQLPNQMNQSG